MLYIFHVETGKMMSFDMNLAMQRVSVLKEHMQDMANIPVDKQVLLISGGESLEPEKTICSYSAGTDTNPIFLFSRSVIEDANGPPPQIEPVLNEDLLKRVREYIDLPVGLGTLSRRAQFAQHFYEVARELQVTCEQMIHDQHLQHQGWSAVLANLEDIVIDFQKRLEIFQKTVKDYMDYRETYIEFLSNFDTDLEQLQRIPVLAVLLELEQQNSEGEGGGDSKTTEANATSSSTGSITKSKELTLYEWMSSSDDKSTLNQVYEHCQEGLEQFNERLFAKLNKDLEVLMQSANSEHMKEIKGLGERLIGLNHRLEEAKATVRQQLNIATSFVNNQNRANNTKDMSVLPDLCLSHKEQLKLMADHHQSLLNFRRSCIRSKNELSSNLHGRLRWVMYVEQQMVDYNHMLVIYHDNLKRLQKYLEILQQIHVTPTVYLNAIVEVVRRKEFSQAYLLWSSELACHLLTIHNEELARRKEFQTQFENHFLKLLFPGLDDLPPSYGTQAPPVFDIDLPKITDEDVQRLRIALPDLAEHLSVPASSALANFFLIKSLMSKKEEIQEGEPSSSTKDVKQGEENEKALKALPHLKDLDRGCESETDTEEFEKVGQSPLELNFDQKDQTPSPCPQITTQDVATLTEDNLQTSRTETEKLTSALMQVSCLSKEKIEELRLEMSRIKSDVLTMTNKNNIGQTCENLSSSWVMLEQDIKGKEEIINSLKTDHERVLQEFETLETSRNMEIEKLKLEKENSEKELLKSNEALKELKETFDRTMSENLKEIVELQNKLEEKDADKEKCLKETADKLNRDHKAEIESIRSRFRLMTMERSPSDSTLERSGDYSSLPNHTTLLMQMTENFEMDRERAVNEALVRERNKWESILDKKIQNLEAKFHAERELIVRDVSQESTRQINILREREASLKLECRKYQDTIQKLSEPEYHAVDPALMDRIDVLQKENEALKEELEGVMRHKSDDKFDVTTKTMASSITSSKSEKVSRLVNIDQCKIGDFVLAMWDQDHENFRVLQESKYKHFLHASCFESLGLEINDGVPNKKHCIGEVFDKDYCFARKSENRYKVPKGKKFFRVKVRPLSNPIACRTSENPIHEVRPQGRSLVALMKASFLDVYGRSAYKEEFGEDPPTILEKDESGDSLAHFRTVSAGLYDVACGEHGHASVEHLDHTAEHLDTTLVTTEDQSSTQHQLSRGDQTEVQETDSLEHHFAVDSGIVESMEDENVPKRRLLTSYIRTYHY